MNMVEVDGLHKRFGRFQAVEGVTFTVAAGEAFALIGPNGSGKTTTLKSIAGLVAPTSGRVLVDGIDVWRQPREAKARFSYLPQRAEFPENLTAREVVEFYCRLRRVSSGRGIEALAHVGLDGKECVSKAVGTFSGGMTQRLGIAVMLLAGAPVLILDEPTASLDPESAQWLLESMQELKEAGTTIVFSSHVISDVEMVADRAALLVNGKLIAVDRPGALDHVLRRAASPRRTITGAGNRCLKVAVHL